MANNKNLLEDNKATRFPNNDPTKGGRKPSIRNEIKKLMESDGQMKIPAKQVLKIEEDGSVVIKMPTQMNIAMKLVSWAMSGKGVNSIRAIQMMVEQIDGKPLQQIEDITNYNNSTKEDIQKELDGLGIGD